MAFANILTDTDADASDIQQFVDAFNGASGKGQPLDLTALDADRYYVVIKNNHSLGKGMQIYAADGTLLFQAAAGGVLASTAGAAAAALAPAASPTLTGAIGLQGRVIGKRATSTASAAALTLPTDGNTVPITGTTTITSIVATGLAGLTVTLEFATAGCKVTASSTLRLAGDFWSAVTGGSSTLTLHCDGTNWIEVTRAHASPLCAFVTRTTSQSIPDDAWTAISWSADGIERNVGPCWASGNADRLTAVVPGIYLLSAQAENASNSTGRRRIGYEKNGTGGTRAWQANEAASGIGNVASGCEPIIMATAGDYIRIMVRQNSGGALNIAASVDDDVRASLTLLAAL